MQHENAPLCADACNTPVYYTPVSVRHHLHPKNLTEFIDAIHLDLRPKGSATGARNLKSAQSG